MVGSIHSTMAKAKPCTCALLSMRATCCMTCRVSRSTWCTRWCMTRCAACRTAPRTPCAYQFPSIRPGNALSPPTPLLARPLAVIDVQITGMHPDKDCIWEIAVLQVDAGSVVERHSWLLKPACALPRTVSRLSGVLPAESDEQPVFAEIAGELSRLLEGRGGGRGHLRVRSEERR